MIDEIYVLMFGPKDPRSNGYFLVEPSMAHIAILVLYLCIVLVLGPNVMERRSAFQLKKTLMLYNWFQILINAWIGVMGVTIIIADNNFICLSSNQNHPSSVKLFYYYFLVKLLDLMDTIFFTLRKNSRQVTVLHVYHHSAMILTGYFGSRFFPYGQSMFIPTINSFVHVAMYLYYFLSSWAPKYGRELWLKKLITQIQIVQHVLLIALFCVPLISDCIYPKIACYCFIPPCFVNLLLFIDYYNKTYIVAVKRTKNA